MVIASLLGWTAVASIVLSIVLAFGFGYSLSLWPLLKHGLSPQRALRIALLADSASIAVMEAADNGFIAAVPGALNANLDNLLFWTSLGCSLVVAFCAAVPVNKYLIRRGKGHAVAHQFHHDSSKNV